MISPRKRNLILLPGLDGTGILFANLIRLLEEEFQITRISYPSSSRCCLDDLAQMAEDKVPDPQNSIILAESFSGLVALMLLEKLSVHPRGIIFGMCFVEPPFKVLLRVVSHLPIGSIPWAHIPERVYKKICLRKCATSDQTKNLRKVFSMLTPRVIAHRLKLILTFRAPQKSQNWRVPCVYIQATQDYLVPDKAAFWFSQNFEEFSLKKIPGPHFLMQSHAEQCAKFILDFDQFLETGRKFS